MITLLTHICTYRVNMKSMKLRISHDRSLMKMLLPGESAEVDAINNSLLRKHFRTLTSQFLAVFDEYFATLSNVSAIHFHCPLAHVIVL